MSQDIKQSSSKQNERIVASLRTLLEPYDESLLSSASPPAIAPPDTKRISPTQAFYKGVDAFHLHQYKEAEINLIHALHSGDADSMTKRLASLFLAIMYKESFGVKASSEKAEEYFAAVGDPAELQLEHAAYPDHFRLYCLGKFYTHQGDNDRAIHYFTKAVGKDEDPEYLPALYSLGRLLYEQSPERNFFDQGLSYIQKAATKQDARACLLLADYYDGLKKTKPALSYLKKAAELGLPDAHYILGQRYMVKLREEITDVLRPTNINQFKTYRDAVVQHFEKAIELGLDTAVSPLVAAITACDMQLAQAVPELQSPDIAQQRRHFMEKAREHMNTSKNKAIAFHASCLLKIAELMSMEAADEKQQRVAGLSMLQIIEQGISEHNIKDPRLFFILANFYPQENPKLAMHYAALSIEDQFLSVYNQQVGVDYSKTREEVREFFLDQNKKAVALFQSIAGPKIPKFKGDWVELAKAYKAGFQQQPLDDISSVMGGPLDFATITFGYAFDEAVIDPLLVESSKKILEIKSGPPQHIQSSAGAPIPPEIPTHDVQPGMVIPEPAGAPVSDAKRNLNPASSAGFFGTWTSSTASAASEMELYGFPIVQPAPDPDPPTTSQGSQFQ